MVSVCRPVVAFFARVGINPPTALHGACAQSVPTLPSPLRCPCNGAQLCTLHAVSDAGISRLFEKCYSTPERAALGPTLGFKVLTTRTYGQYVALLPKIKVINPAKFDTPDLCISFQRLRTTRPFTARVLIICAALRRGGGLSAGFGRGHERDSGWSIAAGGFRGLPLSRGRPGQPSSVFLKTGFLCVGGVGGVNISLTHTHTPPTPLPSHPQARLPGTSHGSSAFSFCCFFSALMRPIVSIETSQVWST